MRVFWFLSIIVVVAQGAAQGLGRVDFPAAFRQHVIDGLVVRGGCSVALADITAISAGPGHQTVQRVGAAIDAGPHAKTVIACRPRTKHTITAVFTRFQQVFCIDGVIGNHAAQRAAAVQQGRRAANHFDTLNQRRIEERAVQVTGVGALTHAVNQHQHAATIVAAQVHVLPVGAPGAVQHQAGNVTQQVGRRAGGLFLRGGGINHAHHHGGFKGAAGVARGGDGHFICGSKRDARQGADNRQRQK